MKQVVKKSLGAAALGAAIVAAGAGTASAATTDALGPVGDTATGAVGSLPVEDATKMLPGGLGETLESARQALTGGLSNPQGQAESMAADKQGSAPGGGMLGGIPLGEGSPLGGQGGGLPLG